MPISVERFVQLHPVVYHMAEADSWPSIQAHGLRSTEALLDLFGIAGRKREKLLSEHRPEMVPISHDEYGTAWIRDQKPMSDGALARVLQDGLTPRDWYEKLNRNTFFWATKTRLNKFTNAKPYRDITHCVLTVDSESLLDAHLDRTTLSHYNSGSTKPNPFPRGNDCFLPFDEFPFDRWRRSYSQKNIVAEVVVDYSVPDIQNHTVNVDLVRGSEVIENIYRR